MSAIEARIQLAKVNRGARFIVVLLLPIAIGVLFLPQWILQSFSKKGADTNPAIPNNSSLFNQHGWETVGIAAITILIIISMYLLFFHWWSLNKRAKSSIK